MIVPRWGLVRKYPWDPDEQATGVLLTAYEAYHRGARISSDTEYLYEDEGMLKASFGRGKGHTTSIALFAWDNPDIGILVVSPTYERYLSFKGQCNTDNVSHHVLSESNRPFSMASQGPPRIIFYDLDVYAYRTHYQRIRHIQARNPTRKHVLLMGDAVDLASLEKTTVEIEADRSILAQLPEAEYGIASDRRKSPE